MVKIAVIFIPMANISNGDLERLDEGVEKNPNTDAPPGRKKFAFFFV